HHDFAPRNLATVYMGIHATLTGVRGVVAPFIGTALYSGWGTPPQRGPGADAPAGALGWSGLGAWVFFVFAAVSVAGGLLFLRLRRRMEAATRHGAGADAPGGPGGRAG